MPTDSSTIFPLALGLPAASSGCTFLARASPAASWAGGLSFLPSG